MSSLNRRVELSIPWIVGGLLIIPYSLQLYTFAIAQLGMAMHPIDEATLALHGIDPWMVYYGGATSFLESVIVIAFSTLVLRRWPIGRRALIWVLPVFVIYDCAYAAFIGASLVDRLPTVAVDALAWALLVLFPPSRSAAGGSHRGH